MMIGVYPKSYFFTIIIDRVRSPHHCDWFASSHNKKLNIFSPNSEMWEPFMNITCDLLTCSRS